MAVRRDGGTVWAWGHNLFGQRGGGTNTDRSSPVQVQSLTGASAVAGGAYHSLALKSECRDKPGLLPPELMDEVQVALAESSGEFLPAWDELEQRITGQRGGAAEIVAEVRQQVAAAGVDLLAALGAHHLARREPQRAVTQLEEALRRRPDREDLAMKLVAAYRDSGQTRRAEQLSREYESSPGRHAL